MHHLIELFPSIKQVMLELKQQNKFMNKVTLTGKINAMDVAANLFEFTDKTAIVFDSLKTELIAALLDENIKKTTNELSFKAQTIIDILIRNLFERTADVGFLATDTKIINYLTSNKVSDEEIHIHLKEYAAKYSVYNEIVLFDTDANVKTHLNKNNIISSSKDPVIEEALQTSQYIEQYKHTDIFPSQEKTLMYVQRITNNKKVAGVLVLCFKFEDEIQTIFRNLSQNNEILLLCNTKEILASNAKASCVPYNENAYTIIKNHSIAVTHKTSGYQGYTGIKDWYATAILHVKDMQSSDTSSQQEVQKNDTSLLSEKLHIIINKANNILEDISDVIINGELIAAKQKVYLLTPILDNLRNISTALLSSMKTSIRDLEYVVKEAFINNAKMSAHLAIDIMDRNLYERANDSRWWALTSMFQEELSKDKPNTELLHKQLSYINELYTVYTNIILFDTNKTIIATSNQTETIGQKIEGTYIDKTLQNKNAQNYFVSDFEKTPFYDNEATYIYAATVSLNDKTVGGIALVFDAIVEFKAILEDTFPKAHRGFSCFIDKQKRVIASSDENIKSLSFLEIDTQFLELNKSESYCDFITFNGEEQIVASVASSGYREYKQEDNYKNETYCLVFLSI